MFKKPDPISKPIREPDPNSWMPQPCPRCSGKGTIRVVEDRLVGGESVVRTINCPDCRGTGNAPKGQQGPGRQ